VLVFVDILFREAVGLPHSKKNFLVDFNQLAPSATGETIIKRSIMNRDMLYNFLTSKKLSKAAVNRSLNACEIFETWLSEEQHLSIDNEITLEILKDFIQSVNKGQKNLLLGLANVFEYQGREYLRDSALKMRRNMLDKTAKPMLLQDFLKVDQTLIAALKEKGIEDAHQLLKISRTYEDRMKLSQELYVPYNDLLDLVKMADLSRIFAVKAVRTRLYLESGFDTLDKLAAQDPMTLHHALVKFVEESGFEGIPTTPKEAEFTVNAAQKLVRWVTFEAED
jgi:hypothetical protein